MPYPMPDFGDLWNTSDGHLNSRHDVAACENNDLKIEKALIYLRDDGGSDSDMLYEKRLAAIGTFMLECYHDRDCDYDRRQLCSLADLIVDKWHRFFATDDDERYPRNEQEINNDDTQGIKSEKIHMCAGPYSEPEMYLADHANLFQFGETFKMQEWESMKIDFDLQENAKRLAEGNHDPVLHTGAHYKDAEHTINLRRANQWDSGSPFWLPPLGFEAAEFLENHLPQLLLKKVCNDFNAGGPLTNRNVRFASRVSLERVRPRYSTVSLFESLRKDRAVADEVEWLSAFHKTLEIESPTPNAASKPMAKASRPSKAQTGRPIPQRRRHSSPKDLDNERQEEAAALTARTTALAKVVSNETLTHPDEQGKRNSVEKRKRPDDEVATAQGEAPLLPKKATTPPSKKKVAFAASETTQTGPSAHFEPATVVPASNEVHTNHPKHPKPQRRRSRRSDTVTREKLPSTRATENAKAGTLRDGTHFKR